MLLALCVAVSDNYSTNQEQLTYVDKYNSSLY